MAIHLGGRRRARRFVPRLEALEDRSCPAFISQTGSVLFIVGDDSPNAVAVFTDGAGNYNASVSSFGTPAAATAVGVDRVMISTLGGSDALLFAPTSTLAVNTLVTIDQGIGDDQANLNFSAPLVRSLTVSYVGNVGNDFLLARFGAVLNTGLFFSADLGNGNDLFDSVVGGDVTGGSRVLVQAFGGFGNDQMAIRAGVIGIAPASSVLFGLDGLADNDLAFINFLGEADGELRIGVVGGIGNDVVAANVGLSSLSTGAVAVFADGGVGNDVLQVNVPVVGTINLIASLFRLDGGLGLDRCLATPNVFVINCEA